jgi:hypothetical protein
MLRRSTILMLWALATVGVSMAQDAPADTRVVKSVPGNCETNSAELDDVRNEAIEATAKGGVIIAIARLGNRETSRVHTSRRLLAVKGYLVKYGVPTRRIVTAEGERVDGYGRVELYVAGKLRNVLLANPNKALCVECCNTDDADFYPYQKNKR